MNPNTDNASSTPTPTSEDLLQEIMDRAGKASTPELEAKQERLLQILRTSISPPPGCSQDASNPAKPDAPALNPMSEGIELLAKQLMETRGTKGPTNPTP